MRVEESQKYFVDFGYLREFDACQAGLRHCPSKKWVMQRYAAFAVKSQTSLDNIRPYLERLHDMAHSCLRDTVFELFLSNCYGVVTDKVEDTPMNIVDSDAFQQILDEHAKNNDHKEVMHWNEDFKKSPWAVRDGKKLIGCIMCIRDLLVMEYTRYQPGGSFIVMSPGQWAPLMTGNNLTELEIQAGPSISDGTKDPSASHSLSKASQQPSVTSGSTSEPPIIELSKYQSRLDRDRALRDQLQSELDEREAGFQQALAHSVRSALGPKRREVDAKTKLIEEKKTELAKLQAASANFPKVYTKLERSSKEAKERAEAAKSDFTGAVLTNDDLSRMNTELQQAKIHSRLNAHQEEAEVKRLEREDAMLDDLLRAAEADRQTAILDYEDSGTFNESFPERSYRLKRGICEQQQRRWATGQASVGKATKEIHAMQSMISLIKSSMDSRFSAQ